MAEDKQMNQDEQELDRYGVWVKTAPEDVTESEDEDQVGLSDLPSAEESAEEPVESDISDVGDTSVFDYETGRLDDIEQLDDVQTEESPAMFDSGESEEQQDIADLSLDDLDFSDEDEIPSLDDFEAPSFPEATGNDTDVEIEPEEPDFAGSETIESETVESETSEPAELPPEEELQQDLEATEVEQIMDGDQEDASESDQWLSTDALQEEVIPEEDLVSLDDLDLEEPVEDIDPFAALDENPDKEPEEESDQQTPAEEQEEQLEPQAPQSLEDEQFQAQEPPSIEDIDLPEHPSQLEVDTGEPIVGEPLETAGEIEIDEDEIASFAAGAQNHEEDELTDLELEEPEEPAEVTLDISDHWEVHPESSGGEEAEELSAEELSLEEPEEIPEPFSELEEPEIEEISITDLQEEESEEESPVIEQTMPGSDEEIDELSLDDFSYEESEDLPELEEDQEQPPEHHFTPEEQGIDIAPPGSTNHITPDEEAYLDAEDDLQKQEQRDIQTDMNEQERAAFERIQDELADIKHELAELRQQLASRPAEAVPAVEPSVEEPVQEETQIETEVSEEAISTGTGFFEEEDEDETIALTGDELDNILSTAEFTETAGTAEEVEDELIVGDEEVSIPKEEPAQDQLMEETAEREPVPEEEPVILEGDESQVDELADMDIDQELAGIEGLVDETEEEEAAEDSDLEEIELDLDELQGGSAPASEEQLEEEPALEEEMPPVEDEAEISQEPAIEEIESTTTIPEEADELAVTEHDLGEIQPDEAAEFEAFASDVERDIETGEEVEEEPDVSLEEPVPSEEEFLEEPFEPTADEEITLEIPEEPHEPVTPEEALGPEEEPEEAITPEITGEESLEEEEHASSLAELPEELKDEIRSVLSYMDQLLEALPDDKIQEFAQSEHFEVYKRLFEELGLDT